MASQFWDTRYGEEGFAYGLNPNDFLAQHLVQYLASTVSTPVKILSLGEGEGRNAIYLAQLGYHIHCIDISQVGLEKTTRLAQSLGLDHLVTTQCIDLSTFITSNNEKWDAIINIWCHVPASLRRDLHRWISSSTTCSPLKPGALYLLEHYHPDNVGRQVGGPQDPDLCVTPAQLEQELTLSPLLVNSMERQVQEGKYHNGLSAVTQYIGRSQ